MTSFSITTQSILLGLGLCLGLLSSGCQVMSIPAHPVDALGVHPACGECDLQSLGDFHYEHMGVEGCPPDWLSPLPNQPMVGWPVPKWWADWKARQDLPEPPAYPRFQPLPTRPMFQPRPAVDGDPWQGSHKDPSYGRLPDSLQGRGAWQPAAAAADIYSLE